MKATATIELVEIKGRILRFKVTCRDERDLISEGFHERALINTAKFMEKTNGKLVQALGI
jgi:fluoroacetyl-CoA thioesterase